MKRPITFEMDNVLVHMIFNAALRYFNQGNNFNEMIEQYKNGEYGTEAETYKYNDEYSRETIWVNLDSAIQFLERKLSIRPHMMFYEERQDRHRMKLASYSELPDIYDQFYDEERERVVNYMKRLFQLAMIEYPFEEEEF